MRLGRAYGFAAVFIEQPAHFSVESPVGKSFPAFAGTSFERYSARPLRHAFLFDASCLDVLIPGIAEVAIKIIVIHFGLKGWMPMKIAGCCISGKR
jgi:hypothetical protein